MKQRLSYLAILITLIFGISISTLSAQDDTVDYIPDEMKEEVKEEVPKFAPEAFVSTEVSYLIESSSFSTLSDLLDSAHFWLKNSWSPVFHPDGFSWSSGRLQFGF